MPLVVELGKYAFDVLLAYGVTIGLLVALLLISLRQSRKVKAALKDVEDRRAGTTPNG